VISKFWRIFPKIKNNNSNFTLDKHISTKEIPNLFGHKKYEKND
jgi:hypothetical protein